MAAVYRGILSSLRDSHSYFCTVAKRYVDCIYDFYIYRIYLRKMFVNIQYLRKSHNTGISNASM